MITPYVSGTSGSGSRSQNGMKKNNILVVVRVVLALAVWWIIYKGYAAFVEPIFADRIPEILVLVLRSMIVPYTLGLGACYLILLCAYFVINYTGFSIC